MGAYDFSIDTDLVERLRGALPLSVFVETGTFEGEAVARVLPFFDELHSVELAPTYHAAASERFREHPNVRLHLGDSRDVLRDLRWELEARSVLYWLDAHWCAVEEIAAAESQCPLLDELDAIGTLNDESIVLIDDARLFLATPPPPHDPAEWPRFQEVIEKLVSLNAAHQISVVNDVIAFYPASCREAVSAYAQARGIDLLAQTHRLGELERECAVHARAAAERLAALEELQESHTALERVAAERLALINELTLVANERLEQIAEARGASGERLRLRDDAGSGAHDEAG